MNFILIRLFQLQPPLLLAAAAAAASNSAGPGGRINTLFVEWLQSVELINSFFRYFNWIGSPK